MVAFVAAKGWNLHIATDKLLSSKKELSTLENSGGGGGGGGGRGGIPGHSHMYMCDVRVCPWHAPQSHHTL